LPLDGGTDPPVSLQDYLDSLERLLDIPEVAIAVAPDLSMDLTNDGDLSEFLDRLLTGCAQPLDRMAVLDVPSARTSAPQAVAWVAPATAGSPFADDPIVRRAGAVYHPWVRVRDPLGGTANPIRD